MSTRETSNGRVRPGETTSEGRGPHFGPVPPEPAGGEPWVAGEIAGLIVRPLRLHRDGRGWLVELFRHDELEIALWPAMAYASMTLPGVSRGPHEHRDQSDGFAFFGPGDFRLYAWDARPESPTRGHRTALVVGASNPCAVWVPPGVVHAYRNISEEPGLVVNAPNRLYAGWDKAEPVDEIRHEEADPSAFPMD
jgi:dTDP-4-dehydrorhamnose 3,5-epimerase